MRTSSSSHGSSAMSDERDRRSRRPRAGSPSSLLMRICSAISFTPAWIFGLSSSACSITPSMSPYFWMSCAAVLSPMPGTPGGCRSLALQRDEVRPLLGRHAVLLDDGLRVVPRDVGDPAARHHHGHAVADELQHVAVAGHDDDLVALLLGLLGERREEVVGLEALELDDRDPHRVEDVRGSAGAAG